MDSKNMFRKYRKRLVAEGVAKSLIFGLLVGFAANIVIATVSCFVKVEGLWLISIGLLLVGTLISAPIFYFAKFRPTTKQIAARVDRRLGLEERTITMLELENDDSYIAMRQREDAKDALAATNKKNEIRRLYLGVYEARTYCGAFGCVGFQRDGDLPCGIYSESSRKDNPALPIHDFVRDFGPDLP